MNILNKYKNQEEIKELLAKSVQQLTEKEINKISMDVRTIYILTDSQGNVGKKSTLVVNLSFASIGQIFYEAILSTLYAENE